MVLKQIHMLLSVGQCLASDRNIENKNKQKKRGLSKFFIHANRNSINKPGHIINFVYAICAHARQPSNELPHHPPRHLSINKPSPDNKIIDDRDNNTRCTFVVGVQILLSRRNALGLTLPTPPFYALLKRSWSASHYIFHIRTQAWL